MVGFDIKLLFCGVVIIEVIVYYNIRPSLVGAEKHQVPELALSVTAKK